MEFISVLWNYILPFLVLFTLLVFVHEMGHYTVARRNGVRVEVFSIGFGPELFGRDDRWGTRWRFCAIPLGGYVKMFGDADAASRPGEAVDRLTPEQRKVSFYHKNVAQRAAIVFAGPAVNYLFAVLILALLFMTAGQRHTPAIVGLVIPGGARRSAPDCTPAIRSCGSPGAPSTASKRPNRSQCCIRAKPCRSSSGAAARSAHSH